MATLGEDLRTFITGSTGVAAAFTTAGGTITAPGRVEQNIVRKLAPPRIWFGRMGDSEDVDFDGGGGLRMSRWDIEVYTSDFNCLAIADALKARLNGARGTFGAGTAKGIFVEDHNDDYLLKGLGEDEEGVHAASLAVTIWSS